MPSIDDIEIEPSADPELEIEIEPAVIEDLLQASSAVAAPTALISAGLIEVLPADFPLPLLTRFVPNQALRTAVVSAAQAALAVDVTTPAGLDLADAEIGRLAAALKAVDLHFDEPASIAHELHRHITGLRGEFKREGLDAQKAMARRVFEEVERRNQVAREQRRKEQDEADRKAREEAAKEVVEAVKQHAPAQVVEEMRQQIATTTAPPVAAPAPIGNLRNSTTTKTWRCRLAGTAASEEPNPGIADLSAPQRAKVLEAMKAVVEGRAPLAAFEINWSYLNKRAGADKSAMGIPGFEAFQQGGLRAKGARS